MCVCCVSVCAHEYVSQYVHITTDKSVDCTQFYHRLNLLVWTTDWGWSTEWGCHIEIFKGENVGGLVTSIAQVSEAHPQTDHVFEYANACGLKFGGFNFQGTKSIRENSKN